MRLAAVPDALGRGQGATNYDCHFGQRNRLSIGDPVSFTDVDGKRFVYQVIELDDIRPTGIEQMVSGDWDLPADTAAKAALTSAVSGWKHNKTMP